MSKDGDIKASLRPIKGKLILSGQEIESRAGELAQWVRAPAALPKVMSPNPSTHMVAHNHP